MVAFFLASLVLAADPYSAIAAGKPAIPAPLSSVARGAKEEALLATLKVNADKDTCFTLGVQVQSLCFVPFWTKDDGYDRPALLFSSLTATQSALRKRWALARGWKARRRTGTSRSDRTCCSTCSPVISPCASRTNFRGDHVPRRRRCRPTAPPRRTDHASAPRRTHPSYRRTADHTSRTRDFLRSRARRS